MSDRFMNPSAVILLLTRIHDGNEEILFQKRKNTGYCDGFYDLSASGHVDANESMKHAMCREAKEELGITINENDLEFVYLIHKNSNGCIYYNGYFKANNWIGEPYINEPEKNEELKLYLIKILKLLLQYYELKKSFYQSLNFLSKIKPKNIILYKEVNQRKSH